MKLRNGFTLLEIVLALALSSIVLVALGKLMTSTFLVKKYGDERMFVDRELYGLFNQLTQDLGAALPVTLPEPEDNKDKAAKTEKKSEKTPSFLALVHEDKVKNLDKKLIAQTKKLSFITTSTLPLGSKKLTAPVRVTYELIGITKRSAETPISFSLIRTETQDLTKTNISKQDSETDKNTTTMLRATVAKNIKAFSVTCMSSPEQDKQEKDKSKKQIISTTWGTDDETQNLMPQTVKVYLELWNDEQTASYTATPFEWLFTIYGTAKKNKKDQTTKPEQSQTPDANKPSNENNKQTPKIVKVDIKKLMQLV